MSILYSTGTEVMLPFLFKTFAKFFHRKILFKITISSTQLPSNLPTYVVNIVGNYANKMNVQCKLILNTKTTIIKVEMEANKFVDVSPLKLIRLLSIRRLLLLNSKELRKIIRSSVFFIHKDGRFSFDNLRTLLRVKF